MKKLALGALSFGLMAAWGGGDNAEVLIDAPPRRPMARSGLATCNPLARPAAPVAKSAPGSPTRSRRRSRSHRLRRLTGTDRQDGACLAPAIRAVLRRSLWLR